jgi:dTDP-4-amino-4,6-dideoxygalactose transaminase
MRALVGWNKRRQELAARYDRLLARIPALLPPARRQNCEHVYHLYVIRHPERDRLRAWLEAQKIPTGIHYPKPLPLYRAYAYLGHSDKDFPVATVHAREILSLPMHPFLTEAEQDEIVAAIAAFNPG